MAASTLVRFSPPSCVAAIIKQTPPTLSSVNNHLRFSQNRVTSATLFTSFSSSLFPRRTGAARAEQTETEEDVELESDDVVEPESKRIFKPKSRIEIPKGEEVFAVVMIGSRQYIVFPGRFIYTQRLKGANVNDKIILSKVLLVGTKSDTYIGKPVVPNAAVHAVVESQGLNKKVIVFKYKKKKNYRRNIGHRQPHTRIRITGITGYQDSPAATIAATVAA